MKRILLAFCLSVLFFSLAMAEEIKNDTTKPQTAPPQNETAKKADTSKMKDSTKTTATAAKEIPWTTSKSGLKWRDIAVGKGTECAMEMPVLCHYTVWLSDSAGAKTKFVQSSKEGPPFQCTIGHNLIQGWSEGMTGMKEGGKRELIVPPSLAWGNRAMGNDIPANSTVYFEIEFISPAKK